MIPESCRSKLKHEIAQKSEVNKCVKKWSTKLTKDGKEKRRKEAAFPSHKSSRKNVTKPKKKNVF